MRAPPASAPRPVADRLPVEPGRSVRVTHEYHVYVARRATRACCEALGFGEQKTYYAVTAASELANNLCWHTSGGGVFSVTPVRRRGMVGVELCCEDEGPGIADVAAAMSDGFSTNGGLGGGLPGVERLMDEFSITSRVGEGTRVVTRAWLRSA